MFVSASLCSTLLSSRPPQCLSLPLCVPLCFLCVQLSLLLPLHHAVPHQFSPSSPWPWLLQVWPSSRLEISAPSLSFSRPFSGALHYLFQNRRLGSPPQTSPPHEC